MEETKQMDENVTTETAAEESVENVEEVETTAEEDAEGTVEEVEEEAAETEETSSEHKFFKKKKDKKDKKEDNKKDEQIAELNDKLMRTMAEFDNFRKRSEREKSQMFEVGAKSIVEKILPVIDNFERGLGSVPEAEKGSAFVQGMEQIYKQFMTSLESVGVTPIDAVGKEFDPNFHNAVMHAEDENYGENIVSEELQKGYMYKETVVRHSMVKVVN